MVPTRTDKKAETFKMDTPCLGGGLSNNTIVPIITSLLLDAASLLTIRSFLLAVELFYLQLTILAFLLTIGAFLLTNFASLLTIGAFFAYK